MGAVYDEFLEQLEDWKVRYKDNPREEMLQLSLMALEREQIVSVAFHESIIEHRLSTLTAPEEVKEMIRHALLWAWKDEEMHAVYIRGFLIKWGRLPLRIQAVMQQISGSVGGWASSTTQNFHYHEAPIARAAAAVITNIGRVTAKVPEAVSKELEYNTFRRFCKFNVDAEHTAAKAWERLVEIVDCLGPEYQKVLEHVDRMRQDEENHRLLFELFAEAFDDNDHIKEGFTAEVFQERIAALSPFFLPPRFRPEPTYESFIGEGGEVHVHQGHAGEDKIHNFNLFVDSSGLRSLIQQRAELVGKSMAELKVCIKASFMLAYHRKDKSTMVDPKLLHALGRKLHDWGCRQIIVMESRNLYDSFFKNRSVEQVAKAFGFDSPYYDIVESDEQLEDYQFQRGMAANKIARDWRNAEFRISFTKMRSHPVDLCFLSLCNLQGLNGRTKDYLFFDRMAQRHTPTLMVLQEFPPDFTMLDAYDHIADGIIGTLGGRKLKHPLRFYAGKDLLSVDVIAAKHMKSRVLELSPVYSTARHWYGDPEPNIKILGPDKPIRGWRAPHKGVFSSLLSILSYPVYQFGSRRGSYFVPSMDTKLFPAIADPCLEAHFMRRMLQSFLGLPYFRERT